MSKDTKNDLPIEELWSKLQRHTENNLINISKLSDDEKQALVEYAEKQQALEDKINEDIASVIDEEVDKWKAEWVATELAKELKKILDDEQEE